MQERATSALTFPSAVDTTVTCVVKSPSSSNEGSVMMVPSNTPQVKGTGTCCTTNVVGASGAEKVKVQKHHRTRELAGWIQGQIMSRYGCRHLVVFGSSTSSWPSGSLYITITKPKGHNSPQSQRQCDLKALDVDLSHLTMVTSPNSKSGNNHC